MNEVLIFVWVWAAMIAMSFWESAAEGRKAWNKGKVGWSFKIGKFVFAQYHFFLFYIMLPLFLTLPFIVSGWDLRLFGILASAYCIGMLLEDFMWYVVNPKVKIREFWTKFSDYYPWIRIGGKKIIPLGYVVGLIAALAFCIVLKQKRKEKKQ